MEIHFDMDISMRNAKMNLVQFINVSEDTIILKPLRDVNLVITVSSLSLYILLVLFLVLHAITFGTWGKKFIVI